MIREVTQEDFPTIAYYMEKMGKIPFEEEAYQKNPFSHFLLLEEEKIIGFIAYTHIYERYEIEYIYVEKPYRKRGYGYRLLSYVIEDAQKNKAENITLEVHTENVGALVLYQKCGFEIATTRKGYYGGKDGYLMLRKL